MADFQVLALAGDGIGPEVMAAGLRVCRKAADLHGLALTIEEDLLHGACWEKHGTFIRDDTVEAAKSADAVLVGAVGGPKWDDIKIDGGPEMQDGLMRLRFELETYCGLRPARFYSPLESQTPFKPGLAMGADIMVVREMCGGAMFAEPRGREIRDEKRYAYDTAGYGEGEIARIARSAFELAKTRTGKLVSADKANVMESYVLWREVVSEVSTEYPEVELQHLYADNCSFQMMRNPAGFDVVLGCNLIGDFLSDLAAVVSGSLGTLPSACLSGCPVPGEKVPGIYEPVHGSAPDIAGRGLANPIAMILSVGMMFEHSFGLPEANKSIEKAVHSALAEGFRTADLGGTLSTQDMCDAIMAELTQ